MEQPRLSFFASVRGRLLFFNLLVVAVTLMVSGVAVLGFEQASRLQKQVQERTLRDMSSSMALARDTANVATAAVRLSQVVGALEFQSEAASLQETQLALRSSLAHLANAPLASHEPLLVKRIIERSNELETSVARMLNLGHRRHLERNLLLSALYQTQSYLHHLQEINQRDGLNKPDAALLKEMDRLLLVAIQTSSPKAAVQQLTEVMQALPAHADSPLVEEILQEFSASLYQLLPLSITLENSDLSITWYMYHVKALVAFLNQGINIYVQKVGEESLQRSQQNHKALQSIITSIGLFALLALVITGFAGWYIYHNLGSNLTAISHAMTRLARGEKEVSVPAQQRRDELGELARALTFCPQYRFAGADITSSEREKYAIGNHLSRYARWFCPVRQRGLSGGVEPAIPTVAGAGTGAATAWSALPSIIEADDATARAYT